MSDSAEAKAREIGNRLFNGFGELTKSETDSELVIAAALREWGEAEVKKAHKEWLKDQCLDDVAKRADAEGYARGFAEGKTQGQQKHE